MRGFEDIFTICAVPMLSLKVSWNSSKHGEQRFKTWEIVKVSPTKLCLEGSEWSNFGFFVWYSHLLQVIASNRWSHMLRIQLY